MIGVGRHILHILGLIMAINLLGGGVMAQVKHNFKKEPEKTNCHRIEKAFDSEKEGIKLVEKSSFRFVETMTISRYKVPNAVSYYSCDGKDGYLVAKESKEVKVLYSSVPKIIWDEFTKADDPFSFYKEKIIPLKSKK